MRRITAMIIMVVMLLGLGSLTQATTLMELREEMVRIPAKSAQKVAFSSLATCKQSAGRRNNQKNFNLRKFYLFLILALYITFSLFFADFVLADSGEEKKDTAILLVKNGKMEEVESHNEKLSPEVFKQKVPEEKKRDWGKKRNQILANYRPPKGKIEILATGYSSTPDQTWGDPFTTASGTRVHWGTIACPPEYPFGVEVTIEDLGTFVCEDRGGAIKGNHFDIWFHSRAEALQWGKRLVVATISK